MSRLTALALVALALAALAGLGLSVTLAGVAGSPRAYLPAVNCAGCAGGGATPNPPAAPEDAWAVRFVQLVNARRVAADCPAVTWSPALAQAAHSIATTWTPPTRWSRAIYKQHGYSEPVVDIFTSRASTPEQAIVAFEQEWGVLNDEGITIIPSPIFSSCHRTGDLQTSYDLGIGLGGEHIIVALAEDFVEARMVDRVNEARIAAGCPAASPNASLMWATGDWSAYIDATGDAVHAPVGWYMSSPYLYPNNSIRENLAGGTDRPDLISIGWLNSPRHRRNMLWCYRPGDPAYHPAVFYEIGIGYVNGHWTLAISDRAP